MKKLFFTAIMAIAAFSVNAQNIQVHYDFGKHLYSENEGSRQDVTITYETFKADKLGSWFYFIDLDLDKNGALGAYTELSREFNFAQLAESNGLAAHVEFDGGMSLGGGQFQTALLVGPAWNWHSADFSKTFSLQLMYKHFLGQNYDGGGAKNYASYQLTGVWGLNFLNNKLTFSGFMDFWGGKKSSNGKHCLVFLTEPQLWYNINKSISVGTEIELSNNFIFASVSPWANDKFYVNPTLAVKFNL